MRLVLALVVFVFVAVPAVAQPHPPDTATVDFGILPLAPIGGPELGCLQTGGIGGPTDPCSYKLHVLTPGESVISKGGEVTFHIRGGGHGFAIYEVSKDTTREELGQFLCPGDDPATIAHPSQHTCNLSAANANARHVVLDGKDDVVLVAETNVTNAHPDNRVWSPPGRLTSAGGQVFLNGGSATAPLGQLLTFRFLKSGRYVVICMNRVHFLNDWMFGFVDVVE